MKYLHKFFLLLLSVSVLSGCLNTSPKEQPVEKTNTVLSSTLTATPRPTRTPGSPTTTATLAVTPIPPLIPTFAFNENSSTYQLVQPAPEGLLALADLINTQHDYFSRHYGYEDNPNFDFMLNELSNLLAVVEAETNLYYPEGFPNPEIIWNYYPLTAPTAQPVFPSAYLEALRTAIFAYLNQRPGELKDRETRQRNGYTVKIYQVELDHDPEPEWLVQMDWEKIVALSWLVLDQNPDGTYTRLKQSLPDIRQVFPVATIETLQDFTGDGLTDIIFLDYGYAADSYFYKFRIAQGTRNGFKEPRAVNLEVPVSLSGDSDPYVIAIPPGSTWLNLTISEPHNLNWGCAWTTRTSYRWSYGREQVFISGEKIPKTSECSLARAVSVLEPVNDTVALRLLENAVHHFDPNNIDQHGKLLFAHYRLAILYAALNQSLSRQHLEWIIQNSTGSEQYLREKMSLLLEEEKINPIRLCEMMYRSSEAELPADWQEYLSTVAAVHAFPGSAEIYPPAICPLQDIMRAQLRKVNLSVQPIPEKALIDQGIPVAAIQTYPFPRQGHPASFMLIGEKTLYLVSYVPTARGWQWRLLEEFDPALGLPQTFFEDATGDGFPELAYSQPDPDWYCPGNGQGYKISLTTYSGIGFLSLTQHVCHPITETFALTRYLPDKNGDGLVDWVTGQLRAAGGDSSLLARRVRPGVWFTLDEIRLVIPEQNQSRDNQADLISRLYEPGRSAVIRRRLIRERDNLNLADEWADREWQRLTYLIAVSYQTDGQTDQALETFTAVLQSENQTLWGNLAALHLMPK